jgi:hypothetical protein
MRALHSDYSIASDPVEDLISGFRFQEEGRMEAAKARLLLVEGGYDFCRIKANTSSATVLACDCSVAYRQLRYHSLWAVHAVAVSMRYDEIMHPDRLSGNGSIPYTDLMHSSYIDVGEILPYSDVDVRGNLARLAFELESLATAYQEMSDAQGSPDFVLIDGSLYTNRENLKAARPEYPETKKAAAAIKRVMSMGKAIGQVEDSHATDVSIGLGLGCTNMQLFELALQPGEYVVDKRDGICICHIKLPEKPLTYLPNPKGRPLTVRWEFNFEPFDCDLGALVGMWLQEDDVLHPQLYPIRLADHLSRRIRTGGILDELVARHGFERKHRDMREG